MFYINDGFIEGILVTLCICFLIADIILIYLIIRVRNNQYVEIDNSINV